jgi:acetoin:2,6-dichlorophenolindophenol oxidoreductase subunit beta
MVELRYGAALNRALADAMEDDSSVVVIGEDIAGAGGSFGVTRGLLDRFGAQRVFDTPISEAALTGMAVGAAMSGLKPVVEIMFMDFTTLAMDALVNQAAKARFMFGGQTSVPMVLRTPHGGGLSAGPQHSQCLEAWFAHVPGLKVVCPSNALNAYGLLRSSISDPDPVIFVEHKGLYARKDQAPDDLAPISLGQAATVRRGEKVTVVSYGAAVALALEAADRMAERQISIEVIDLQTLQPWDEQTVLASLKRTHRLVMVHEAVEAFGIGAEIAARMADVGFDELDGPIVRVGAPFMPIPFAGALEQAYRPSVDRVVAAILKTMGKE